VRLIRKNCRYCAQPYEPEPHMMKNVPMAERESAQFRRGAGCDQCLNTGFSGRTAVTELLKADHIFRAAVMDKVPTRVLQDVAISQGMQTMWQRGLRRALSGETTLEEIQRVISVDEI
jgi:type II secretory ATPase GspE/PulE/Tfp pilus assembly ATPase PilB-like protein